MKKNTPEIRTLAALAASLMVTQLATAATATWSGAGPDGNWSTAANWTGATPSPANDVKFYDPGATNGLGVPITNIVNASQSILSLQYGNTNNIHTTLINPGVTLTNLGNLMAGTETDYGGVVLVTSNLVIGAGGTLVMTNTSASITVRQGANGVTGSGATLDMSGLDTFIATLSRVGIGEAGVNRSTGVLLLAKTNQITASGTTPAISVGLSGSNNGAGRNSTLALGQTNAIFANSISVGRQKETAVYMLFNTTVFPDNPVAFFRGADGVSRISSWAIGDGESNSGTTSCNGTCNFAGGTVDAMVDTMTVGRASSNTGGTGQSRGTLTFDGGIIDVNTLQVGFQTAASGAKYGDATVNVRTNALLIVNNSLQLGMANNPTNTSVGRLNIDGGTVDAASISTSTNSVAASPSPVTLSNGGTLILGSTAGTPAAPLSELSVSDSLLNFFSVSTQSTNMVVNNLTAGGTTNLISISVLPGITTYPVKYRLIKSVNYPTLTTGFGLTNLPQAYTAYVTNDTDSYAIDLVITAGPVAEAITWSGALSANWDTTTANWLAGATPRTYASGDYVTFDDNASVTAVNLPTLVLPSTITVNNTTKPYTFSGPGSISGATGVTKNGANSLTIANTGANDFTGPIVINGGSLIYTRNSALSLPNPISGAGTFTKSGSGTMTLNGANTGFTGAAQVAQGVLVTANASALGTTNGGTTVSSGATLDVYGQNLGAEPVAVGGAGVNAAGAIINSGIQQQNALQRVTLTANTTFGGANRWDIRSSNTADPAGASLSTGGNAYNLIKTNINTVALVGATIDPMLADVDIQQGTLAVESGTTGLGNPAANLTVRAGGTLQLYNTTNLLNKVISFTGDGVTNTVNNASGANTIIGPVTLNGNCLFNVGGTSLTLSGGVGGSGSIVKVGGNNLILAAANNFTGNVIVTNGTFTLNSSSTGGGVISNTANATICGNGTNSGPAQVAGTLNPGDINGAGTFGSGALTLYPSARLTFDLAAINTTGAGINDLLEVNGNIVSTSTNSVMLNLLDGTLQAGTYRLINYTGSSFPSGLRTNVVLSSGGASRYGLRLDTNTLGQVNLVVVGSGSDLKWNSTSSSVWDVANTPNWLDLGASVASAFYQADSVLLDDSVSGVQPNITLGTGIAVAPSAITNNSDANNYTITGAGKITAGSTIVKKGASTLLLGTANDFLGPVLVQAGTLQVTNNSALGATNGATTIASGATLDVCGVPVNNTLNLGLEPIIVSGAGVGGNGAIVSSGPNQQQNAVRTVTMVGDTWFGGVGPWGTTGNNPGRWDFRGTGAALSTGGNPYKLYKTGANQVAFVATAIDSALADIDVQQGLLAFETTTTSMGNPASTLTVRVGGTLSFYNTVPLWDKVLVLYGDGVGTNVFNWSGSNTFVGPVTVNDDCVFAVRGTALTFTGAIGGPGGLVKKEPNSLYLYGANTYAGATQVRGGTLFLAGSGSIANSAAISVGSGATLDVSTRSDGTLTLASGKTLTGSGTVLGSVIAGSGSVITAGDTAAGTLTIMNNLTLNGSSNVFELNTSVGDHLLAISNNLVLTGVNYLYIAPASFVGVGETRTVMYYAGTLTGNASNFQVVSAPGYGFELVLSSPNLVQVRATSAPLSTYWVGGNPAGRTLWDTTTYNWMQDYVTPTNYSNLQVVNFAEYPVPLTNWVTLVGDLTPSAVLFNNSGTTFTLAGNGRLTGPSGLTLQGGGTVILANSGSNDYSGSTLINSGVLQVGAGGTAGNLGIAPSITNQGALVFNRSDAVNATASITGYGTLTNIGAGILRLSARNDLSGEITAARGTIQVDNIGALGSLPYEGGTSILPGATLDLGGPSLAANVLYFTNELITVSGSGVGGLGAIINSSTNRQYNALRTVRMTGDTTFGGPGLWSTASQSGRWDIRYTPTSGTGGSLDTLYQPYKLTKTGSNQVSLVGVTIDATPGTSLGHIDVQQGLLGFEGGTTSMGDPTSNIVVRAGAAISFYGTTTLWNKNFVLYGDRVNTNILNWSGNNTMIGPVTLNGGCVFSVTAGILTNNGAIGGAGSLVKTNSGLLILGGANSYAGNTVVGDGRLAFAAGSTLPASPVFDLAGAGAILDISAIGGSLTLNSGQTLRGMGTLWGSLTANAGSTVAPGESVGTLTITNGAILNGSTVMELDRGTAAKSDQINTPKSIVVNGTLTVNNIGASLQAGDSFKLFSASSYSGSALASPALPSPGAGLAWTNSLVYDGRIAIYATVSTVPTNISYGLNGSQLTLRWPATHTGWRLQTNAVDVGNSASWFTYPGSTTVNQVIITVDPNQPKIFYRLVYP